MRPKSAAMAVAGLLVVLPTGYDIARAYWLPIELNRAMGGHYALPMVSSRQDMNRGLREKKRDWRKRDIEFTYQVRRVGEKTHLRGEVVVETRFIRYAGIPQITVSMDRNLIVAEAEIPNIKTPDFSFQTPDFNFKMPNFRQQKW